MLIWKTHIIFLTLGALFFSNIVLARFVSVDPVSPLDYISRTVPNVYGFNRYSYANNNPYRYTDADGREVVPIVMNGLNSSSPVLQSRTFYVDKKIANDVQGFVGEVTGKYNGLSVNNTFRLQNSSTINTTNTKAKGLSRHQAGFAIDMNGTGRLNNKELQDVRSISNKYGLTPALIPNRDKPHFSADPTQHGYSSLQDAVKQNKADYLKKTQKPKGGTGAKP